MKINRLILTNFRSHRSTEFSFSRINVGRGTHGTGKTSIQLAIEMLLTGKCDRTDLAGRGAQSLISAGAKEFRIEALTDKAEIQFRRNGTGGDLVIGNRAGKAAYAWIEGNIAPLPVLSAVLNSGRFLEMDEREQKALLAGALAADPVAIDPEIVTLANSCFNAFMDVGNVAKTEVRSAAEIDAIYQALFKSRADVNRDLKNMGELTPPEKPEGMPMRQDVTDLLKNLRGQRDDKARERYKIEAGYNGRRDKLDAAKAAKAQYEPEVVVSSEELAKLDKLAKKKPQAAKLDATIAELQSSLTAQRNELSKLKEEPSIDKCPLCGAPRSVGDRSQMIAILEGKIPQTEAELTAKQTERTKLGDPATAQAKLDKHFAAIKHYQKAETAIAEVGELGAAPDVATLVEEITELETRIAHGEEIERECVAYEAKVQEHQKVAARAKRLEEQSEALDKLVEYFSDRGPLKAKLVGGKLPAFRDRINEVLARFGFVCQFELEPYRILVGYQGGGVDTTFLSLGQLSESEGYRFAIAFQIALAEATGVNFVVIDRSDMLLPAVRSQLARALDESNLDQAIVLCAGEPLESYPNVEGLTFFELDNVDGATQVRVPNAVEA